MIHNMLEINHTKETDISENLPRPNHVHLSGRSTNILLQLTEQIEIPFTLHPIKKISENEFGHITSLFKVSFMLIP